MIALPPARAIEKSILKSPHSDRKRRKKNNRGADAPARENAAISSRSPIAENAVEKVPEKPRMGYETPNDDERASLNS